jgi:hypothetical protein
MVKTQIVPLTTDRTCARVRNDRLNTERLVAVPAGLTHSQAVQAVAPRLRDNERVVEWVESA